MEKNRIAHPTLGDARDTQWKCPEIAEYRGYKTGDVVEWIDQETAEQFKKPAFGYGEGSFTIRSIRHWEGKAGLFEIETPKGLALIHFAHFKKSQVDTNKKIV